ncbi:MAG TPA: FTR1 family protein [Anaerolineales bacterium]|nr:FTR1 family protein [Anaerolineales bacterium]
MQMQAFVITLREGLEAALIVGLILTYLNRSGREAFRRWAFAGLTLAATASLLGAWIFTVVGLDPENELLEGVLQAVAAVLVFSLVVWMWRASRDVKKRLEARLDSLTAPIAANRQQGWAVLGLVFFMVFREGLEMVLFLAALSLTAQPNLIGLVGGLAGLALAALFGVLFVKGSLRINLRRFFGVTGLVLMLLVARLAAGSLHEFTEAGLLPEMAILGAIIEFLTNERTSTLILMALIALPVLSMLPELRVGPEVTALRPGESNEDHLSRLAALRRARAWQAALVSVTLGTVIILSTAM